MNNTPSSNRIHIGIFGKRNTGKSSIINAITSQNVSIVSDFKGTTTDPVYKSMELLPIGPVVIIDTAGMDDDSFLGEMRIKKTYQVINKTDIAIIVVDASLGISEFEKELIKKFNDKDIPYIIVMNKEDLYNGNRNENDKYLYISAKTGKNIFELKELIASKAKLDNDNKKIVGDLISPQDFIVLVVPIDSAAPKGRLILPQQQTIRDILNSNAIAIVTRENELKETLNNILKKPKLIICDSQVFSKVNADTPKDIPLTSFSILFARYKGNLKQLVNGAKAIDNLKDGDTVLISEGCTHHRQCDDIGTVKIPKWLKEYTGKNINIETSSGLEFPEDLSKYSLIIHCGGCMLNEKEMKYRIKYTNDFDIPIVNYGILIAYIKGILERSLEPFSQKYLI